MTGKYWDRPWSLVDGCTPCSPGCEHCWSMTMAKRFKKWPDHVTVRPDRLDIPLKTRKRIVFSVWNDLFHEDVPDDFIDKVIIEIIPRCPQHTFLVLTKRPQRVLDWCCSWDDEPEKAFYQFGKPIDNLWLGVTVCNQAEADEKIPLLLQTPAAHRWVSIEPMIADIDLEHFLWTCDICNHRCDEETHVLKRSRLIDAVILGGETGPGARPMHPDWVRSVRDQCQAAGVPFFFKQWGKHLPSYGDIYGDWNAPPMHVLVGDKSRLLDGREHNELPWRDGGKNDRP